ncbi:MAG: diguanylate cyclase [Planktothrix sp. GU0601_MAG3]|nr:MAG: diguanylate cyclase [Planktothrix sp. GU0601_MAG3]
MKPLKLSLRQLLVIPFVLQIVLAVGITGFFSHRNGQKAVNDLAAQLHEEISDRIELSLKTYLDQARLMNETNRNALTQKFISVTDFTRLKQFFLSQIKAFPSIDYLAWGSEQGEYIGVQRINNQQFNLEIVQNSTQDWFHIYRLTPTGERGKLLERLDGYDPRRRPWYQAATQAKTGIWTPIYVWFAHKTLAMDAVLPIYDREGHLLGVLDTALYLSDISDFLRNMKIGKSGQSFIIDRSGLLIAGSSVSNPFIIKNDKIQRIKAVNSDDILIRETAKTIQNQVTNFESIQRSIALDFQWHQERYIVKVFPFLEDPRGIDWLICIVVPERDFMDLIIHNTRVTFFLCILALVIATILGIITAHRITAPLIQLSQATEAIAQGELDQNIEVNREDELGILARSFNQMTQRLKCAFEELEIRVAARTAELKEAKADLENYNKKLEDRVYQRTVELSLALENLQKTQVQLLKQEEKLKFDAFHDSLTGLPNRAWLLNKIQHLIEINQKISNYLYAVLFLDLDRFKVINDSLGHLVGDELLKSVAHRIRSEIKSQDTVARLGGDEFIVLLENIHNQDEVTDIAQRIIEQLKRPFYINDNQIFIYINDNQIFIGVSIGITLSSMGYSQAEAVIRDADIAMYNAKHLGKGCYQILTQAMQIPARQILERENQLRQALIREIQSKSKGAEIIRTIILLAHSLGMDVVAEGVETKIQLDKLTELGCNYGQGYLISEPLDCSKATEFLISQLG